MRHGSGNAHVRRVGGNHVELMAAIEVASSVAEAEAGAPLGDLRIAACV
jgi:hypothetical protein